MHVRARVRACVFFFLSGGEGDATDRDECESVSVDQWTDELTDEWIRWTDELTDEWINGPMNGSINGPMDQTVAAAAAA